MIDKVKYKAKYYLAKRFSTGSNYRESVAKQPLNFIVSTGRTGTKFLARIINSVEGVTGLHEPGFGVLDLAKSSLRGELTKEAIFSELMARRYYLFTQAQKDNNIFVESNYALTFLVEYLLERLSNIKVVFVVRDPRRYIISAYSKKHGKETKYALFDKDDRRDRITIDDFKQYNSKYKWDQFSRFEKICWNWRYYNEPYFELSKKFPQVVLVRFEDIFNADCDFSGLRRICKHFSVDADFLKDPEKLQNLMSKRSNASKEYNLDEFDGWENDQKAAYDSIVNTLGADFGY